MDPQPLSTHFPQGIYRQRSQYQSSSRFQSNAATFLSHLSFKRLHSAHEVGLEMIVVNMGTKTISTTSSNAHTLPGRRLGLSDFGGFGLSEVILPKGKEKEEAGMGAALTSVVSPSWS